MLKKVRISIRTRQWQIGGSLFDKKGDTPSERNATAAETEPQEISLCVEGSYHDDGTRVTVSYREGELSGMQNAKTSLFFQKSDPTTLTMTRDGAVRTALVFEAGRRHICFYQTPIMPMEVAVKTRSIKNTLAENGKLRLDYIVEIKGADPERTEFFLELLPDIKRPLSSS